MNVRRRAVVLVGGPAAPYSRAIRIGRALCADGYDVEIAAIASADLAEREIVTPPRAGSAGEPETAAGDRGTIGIRRYRPSGPWSLIGSSEGASGARVGADGGALARWERVLRAGARPLLASRRWLLWPHAVRGWWATLARELTPADLYHACGALTLAAALGARNRQPIGPSGVRVRVIYDAIDDVAESNAALAVPALIRRRNARTEAGWARSADAIVTVNDALADRLAARWRLRLRPLVVPNLPEPPNRSMASWPQDHLRAMAGLAASTRVVLFQGRLGPGLGLEEAAEAVLRVPDAALVLLGFGRGLAACQARDTHPRYAGRHVTLLARHPDELLAWTASADVAIVPLPPVSVNQRLSSPNKFWEALAAGTPVVVVTGLEVMERLVREHDLGAVAASVDPADLAEAITTVIGRLDAEGQAWRERIARTSAERFGWPPVATSYRSLVRALLSADGPANAGGSGSQSA